MLLYQTARVDRIDSQPVFSSDKVFLIDAYLLSAGDTVCNVSLCGYQNTAEVGYFGYSAGIVLCPATILFLVVLGRCTQNWRTNHAALARPCRGEYDL